jgi:NitT/TauT family transport system substrate-binding protein
VKRVKFLAFAVLGLLVGVPARAAEPLIIAQSNDGLLYGPLYLAAQNRYFEMAGLAPEVIVMGGGAKAISAVIAGSAQIYAGAPFELINAVERGQHLVAFAEVMDRVMINLVMRSDTATRLGVSLSSPVASRIAALRGLKLGISSPKSSGEGLYRNLLRRGKLDADRDVDIVPVGAGGAALAAFLAGQVDMYTFSSPFSEQAVARGPGIVLFDLSSGEIPEYADYPYITLIAREDWLRDHADTAQRVVRALAQALSFLHAHPDEAKTSLQGVFPKIEAPLFAAAFAASLRAYPAVPDIVPESFTTALSEYALVYGRAVTVTPAQLATNRIVAATSAP